MQDFLVKRLPMCVILLTLHVLHVLAYFSFSVLEELGNK